MHVYIFVEIVMVVLSLKTCMIVFFTLLAIKIYIYLYQLCFHLKFIFDTCNSPINITILQHRLAENKMHNIITERKKKTSNTHRSKQNTESRERCLREEVKGKL